MLIGGEVVHLCLAENGTFAVYSYQVSEKRAEDFGIVTQGAERFAKVLETKERLALLERPAQALKRVEKELDAAAGRYGTARKQTPGTPSVTVVSQDPGLPWRVRYSFAARDTGEVTVHMDSEDYPGGVVFAFVSRPSCLAWLNRELLGASAAAAPAEV